MCGVENNLLKQLDKIVKGKGESESHCLKPLLGRIVPPDHFSLTTTKTFCARTSLVFYAIVKLRITCSSYLGGYKLNREANFSWINLIKSTVLETLIGKSPRLFKDKFSTGVDLLELIKFQAAS